MNISATVMKRFVGSLAVGLGGLLLAVLVLGVPIWVTVKCDRPTITSSTPTAVPSSLPNEGLGGEISRAAIANTVPVNCKLRGQNLIGIPWRNQTIENLVGVELNSKKFRPGRVYRTYLYTYEAEISMATYSVSYSSAQRAYRIIRTFLDTPSETNLKVLYTPPWVTFITALFFAILMLGIGSFVLWI